MKKSLLTKLLGTAAAIVLSASLAQAGIITTGNVEPADPSTWTTSISTYVGNTADGTLTVDGGSTLLSRMCLVGNSAGTTGSASLSGSGTTWTMDFNMFVGKNGGDGYLTITDGAVLSSSNVGSTGGYIGDETGSTGTVVVDGPGSTWTNNAFGLYVGDNGTGTLRITNGGTVSNNNTGYIAYNTGSTGTVAVDGIGSTWTGGSNLYVGRIGAGTLRITNGGTVSNNTGYIAYSSASTSTATVNGTGSTWTNTGTLYVGRSGTGKLSISDGGAVTASAVSINSSSILTTDLGTGSSLTVDGGSGTITNEGTIRLAAGAGAASGTHSPISAGTWTNTGTIQALGGIWDPISHTVTVSDAATALAGEAKTVDLEMTQRVLITDAATEQTAGVSFMAPEFSADLTITAGLMDASELSLLESSLASGEEILTGWNFTTAGDGYAEGDPVYLSLEIGSGYDISDLAVWLFDGSVWSEFLASDLAYDDVYASFTATDLYGYAITGTAPVPIPGAVWLLGSGLLGLAGIRKRRK